MSKLEIVEYVKLYGVSFATDEFHHTEPIYFTTSIDADKCASLKRGWYGSKGYCSEKTIPNDNIVEYYESFDEWAKDTLTYNQYIKLKE